MKILIVLNTVRRAQDIFIQLQRLMGKNDYQPQDVMLIHSRFTFLDRRRLEKRIFEYPRIVVATQVIEVSLDIDYDVLFTEVCYPDSLVQRAGRVNRYGKLGNNGEGLVYVFLPDDWDENEGTSSLPYDPLMLRNSIELLTEEVHSITSEMDYIRLTNEFYDRSWQSSQDAEGRFEEIWKQVRYIYRANLSEEGMIDLLRTRSGILTISCYSRTHSDKILDLDRSLSLVDDTRARFDLQQQIRMYSLNVPILKSVQFTRIEGNNGTEYLIVEADYDSNIGLLLD